MTTNEYLKLGSRYPLRSFSPLLHLNFDASSSVEHNLVFETFDSLLETVDRKKANIGQIE